MAHVRRNGCLGVAIWLTVIVAGGIDARQSGAADARLLKNPVKATPESLAAGQQLYQRHCVMCHLPDGKGQGATATKGTGPSDLTDTRWDYGSTDGEIFGSIRNGIGPNFVMRAYKDAIPERDTWQLVNYVRSLAVKTRK